MTAIEATSVRVRTMADGTLRGEIDFEPRFADAGFKLLGKPGQLIAVVGIKAGGKAEESKPKGGPWSQWLAVRCGESGFVAWVIDNFPGAWAESEDAADAVRIICGVQSRAEIDNDPEAGKRFQERIRTPWQAYCKEHQNG